MSTKRIYLIGAGGHGKVVLDALLLNGIDLGSVFVHDDKQGIQPKGFLGKDVVTPAVIEDMGNQYFHVSIGNSKNRFRVHHAVMMLGAIPLSVVHPRSYIATSASIGEGAFVAAMAVAGPSAVVGTGSILNHGAVVDHDCIVGNFCHIAPNATLAGEVHVGDGVLIGAGANVLPGVFIGENAVVGAGAVVTRDISAGEIYVGVPAKKLRSGCD